MDKRNWCNHSVQHSTAKKMSQTLPPATPRMNLAGTCQGKEARHKELPTAWFNLQKVYKQAKLTPGLEDRMAVPLGRKGAVVEQTHRWVLLELAKLCFSTRRLVTQVCSPVLTH